MTTEANADGAEISINGSRVRSGQNPATLQLEVGRNLVRLEVTAPDGRTTKTYTLNVIRSCPTPNWVRISQSNPWSPRDSAGELVFNGRMWLFGGYTPELVNDVWGSADGLSWSKQGAIPCPSGINIPVCFAYDGRMWVAGNDGKLFSSPDGVNWSLVTDAAPWVGRYAAGAAVFGGRMWVMGGRGKGGLFNDVWSSEDGVHWHLETANAPWSKRQPFGMLAVHDNKLWLLGGGITNYHPFKAYTDVWNSRDGHNWTQVADESPWPARIWSDALVYRNRLWVLGGFRSEPDWVNFNDVWYSTDGIQWRQLRTESIWSPRHEISAYVFDDKLWVFGGNAWPLMNDAWCLDIPGLTFLTQPVIEEFVTAQYAYRAKADFNDSGSKIRYRLLERPEWMTIDADSGLIRGLPQQPGDVPVTVEAFDEAGQAARQSYTLHVLPLS